MSNDAGPQAVHVELHGVIYRDGEWWVSHCLELDIVGQGKTPDEAFRQSLDLCAAQLDAALDAGDLESIIRPAPPEYWALYYRAAGKRRREQNVGRVERVEFRELSDAA